MTWAPEEAFDDLVAIASSICRMPMGAVTLIDRDRQWLKSKLGLDGDQTLREDAFCAHTILTRIGCWWWKTPTKIPGSVTTRLCANCPTFGSTPVHPW